MTVPSYRLTGLQDFRPVPLGDEKLLGFVTGNSNYSGLPANECKPVIVPRSNSRLLRYGADDSTHLGVREKTLNDFLISEIADKHKSRL